MIDHRLLLSACLLPLAFASAPAFAGQSTETASEAGASAQTGGLEDIVVTAQRRSQRLQEVPVSVTAFGETAIQALRLDDALATSKFVPGMISQSNTGLGSANAYFIRGLGNSQSTPTFDAPVTTYVDDVYIARQNANNYAFFDTERVEVMRGPQGTLFGRNTTGGAINVIMRKPQDEFGVKAEASYGSFNRITAKATIDAPINPNILTKVSAYIISDEGYLDNITTGEKLNGEDSWGVRGDLRLLPTEGLTIDYSLEYTHGRGTYAGLRTVPGKSPYVIGGTMTPVFYETAAGLPKTDCGENNVDLLLNTGKGSCNLSKTFATSLNVSYDGDFGTVTGIFGYRNLNQGYSVQYDANTANKYAGYIIVDNGIHKQWSGELKYNGKFADDAINLVTGIFYLKEKSDDRQTTFSGGTTAFRVVTDQHLLPQTETAAIYAQADFNLTDELMLTAGGRYTWEKKQVAYLASTQFPGFGYNTSAVVALGIPVEQTIRKFTPRLAINYKIEEDVMLFASATNGFKSGGWNGGAAAPAAAVQFDPETTWSFEGGLKSELFDRRVRFNATGYFAKTKELQVTAAVTSPITGLISQLPFNAGTLQVYGLEIESSAQFGNFNLFANPSFMNARYTYIVPSSQALTTATHPVRAPKFQFSGGIMYERDIEAIGGSLGGVLTYRHNSPFWVAILNTTRTIGEDFVDASATYKTKDERIAFSLEVSNLTNQKTITANFLSLFPGDPRRFTARVRFEY